MSAPIYNRRTEKRALAMSASGDLQVDSSDRDEPETTRAEISEVL